MVLLQLQTSDGAARPASFAANTLRDIDKSVASRHRTMAIDVPDKSRRMNKKPAEFDGAADRLRAMTKRDGTMARLRAHKAKAGDAMKRFQTDMAEHDAVNARWKTGAIAVAIVIVLAGAWLIAGG